MSKISDIIALLDKGFIHHPHAAPDAFYKQRRCPKPQKADWFARPLSEKHKNARFVCLGCSRRCSAIDPEGWKTLMPHRPSRPGAVAFAVVERLTVDEMLRIKRVLRVNEAAWALNVSRPKVHEWIDEGLLELVPGSPIRVTSASVQRILAPTAC